MSVKLAVRTLTVVLSSLLLSFLLSGYASGASDDITNAALNDSRQTAGYLVIPDWKNGWVDSNKEDLSTELIINKLNFDLYDACENGLNNSSRNNYIKLNGPFTCLKHNAGVRDTTQIGWDSALGHQYYTVQVSPDAIGPSGTEFVEHSIMKDSSHGATIEVGFKDAVRSASGEKYTVKITISDIKVGIRRNIGGGFRSAILMGLQKADYEKWKNANAAPDRYINKGTSNKSGLFNFSAFWYDGDPTNSTGLRYKVTVELTNGGNKTFKLPWAFSDIDQWDGISPDDPGKKQKYYAYDGNHLYAEHVTFPSGEQDKISGITGSKNTQLRVYSHGSGNKAIYSSIRSSQTFNTDMVAMIKSSNANFSFVWGGSGCSTEIIDAPSTLFHNDSTVKYNGDNAHNKTYTVNNVNPSYDTVFTHKVIRDDAGQTVPAADTSWEIKGSKKTDSGSASLAIGEVKTITKTIGKDEISLQPDQYLTVWQQLNYQRTNLNTVKVPGPNNNKYNCKFKDNEEGTLCFQLHRPPANFNGKIDVVVKEKDKNGNVVKTYTDSTANGDPAMKLNSPTIMLPSSSGKYEITFTQTIARKDLHDGGAGGKVATKYDSYTNRKTYFRKEGDNKRYKTMNTNTSTGGLSDNGFITKTFTYSSEKDGGELYYDEDMQYCNYLTVKTWQSGDKNPVTNKACVTIQRTAKTCDIPMSGGQALSVNAGKNYGRVGVKNVTQTDVLQNAHESTNMANGWTTANENNPSQNTEVFAKPGDLIQFTHQMCAGAFYTAEANKLGDLNDSKYGSRYGAVGNIDRSGSLNLGSKENGYLFKTTIPVYKGNYSNPAKHDFIMSEDWRWTNGPNAGKMMDDGGFMSKLMEAEASVDSPDKDASYSSPHDSSENNIGGSPSYKKGTYQVSGKINQHPDMWDENVSDINKTDVGGVIAQSLYWNPLYIQMGYNATRNVKSVQNSFEKITATASVKVPYNYILKPYVDNKNGNDNTRVVYLGETYSMTAGVVTSARENWRVTGNNKEYATITKNTHVILKTYYTHNGDNIEIGGDVANTHDNDIVTRFNQGGYLSYANDVVRDITFKVPDSDTGTAPSVGDKICTEITIWPVDSHDHPAAEYTKDAFIKQSIGGANGETNTGPYANIAIREDSVDGKNNSRTTTSCSMVAKRPTMSVESGNAYSKSGYNMSRYTKDIDARDFNFSSWSEYGVFGKINNVDEHLISGAAVGYNRSSSYYGLNSEGQKKNKTRPNSGDVSTGSNLSSKTCIFETQTFANVNCENKNAKTDEYGDPKNADIGGQSVTDYKQKILDRYRVDDKYKNVNCSSGSVQYGGESYCKVQDLGSGNGLKDYTKNNGSSAIVVKAKDDIYIGGGSPGSIPGAIPKYFTDETVGEGEDNQIDYNRTLVYDASGQSIVIDGDISYNSTGSKLDDIVGVVIIAENVYFTDVPRHIDAVIIAENEVNTCKYAEGVEMKIGEGATLNSDVCNKELIFEAPVITKKLVLNRTHGVGNGVESIQRAEIFNLNMSNYLWSFNQMSRYSQAVTTYSRELPSRY